MPNKKRQLDNPSTSLSFEFESEDSSLRVEDRISARPRVAVAMSGGVDSSVAALLLKKKGYDVAGFMMKLWFDDQCKGPGRENACCDDKSVNDARRVADKLGIPFYLVDAREVFKKEVTDYFIDSYKSLKTPNPCVKCNEKIKFGWLLDFAQKSDCDYLATGHYARIADSGNPKSEILNPKQIGNIKLLKAKDEKKDQGYFLYRLNQEQLSKVIFPLGELTKEEVRKIAKEADLPVHEKAESQEICFIQDKDYREFLRRHISEDYFSEGDIVDSNGYIVGKHNGLINYTIGQRKGIEQFSALSSRFSNKQPLYVIGFDVKNNQVIVGEDKEIYKGEMKVRDLSWTNQSNQSSAISNENITVKIRSRAKEAKCLIESLDSEVSVHFEEPQRAVTPGQSAVLYLGEEVIGGGIIQ